VLELRSLIFSAEFARSPPSAAISSWTLLEFGLSVSASASFRALFTPAPTSAGGFAVRQAISARAFFSRATTHLQPGGNTGAEKCGVCPGASRFLVYRQSGKNQCSTAFFLTSMLLQVTPGSLPNPCPRLHRAGEGFGQLGKEGGTGLARHLAGSSGAVALVNKT
jgi:hypothetical protein